MVRARVSDLDLGREAPAADSARPRPEPAPDIEILRRMSRVRRTVEQVLWESGTVPGPEDVDRLTEAVLDRIGGTRTAAGS
jgi:hypothetical protein